MEQKSCRIALPQDPANAGIIVTDSRRDSSLDNTDAFLVIIDGLLDRQIGFMFGTNIRCSWLRRANSGLYLVYNEVDERFPGAPPNGREPIVKYSHIFDLLD